MDLKTFEKTLDNLSKNEKEMFREFILEDVNETSNTSNTSIDDIKPKDLALDQIVKITQELSDGTIKSFKFKVVEIWPTPANFFTVKNIQKPQDPLNYWILFFSNNSWYIKKGNKSLLNVHVKL